MRYCTRCGAKLVLAKQGKVNYSMDIPMLPYYTINLYVCPKVLWWPLWAFSRHDAHEKAETTEIYKIEKAKYDKTHQIPLPNPGNFIRKGI